MQRKPHDLSPTKDHTPMFSTGPADPQLAVLHFTHTPHWVGPFEQVSVRKDNVPFPNARSIQSTCMTCLAATSARHL